MNPHELFARFGKMRVLVIGDLIIDISTELAPLKNTDDGTPVYRNILDPVRHKGGEISHGGAGLVVRNLLELGAHVEFVTATGYGECAQAAITFRDPKLRLLACHTMRPQTVKHRYWCNGRKVLQIDTVDNSPLSSADADAVMISYVQALAHADVVIVADYRHGLISEDMAREIVRVARHARVPIYVSSQVSQARSNHYWYEGTTYIVGNSLEISCISNPSRWEDAAPPMFTTLGDRGCTYLNRNGATPIMGIVPAIKIEPVDCVGAGDAFLAAISLSCGEESGDMMNFANTWAGLSCTVKGANPPTRQMLIDWSNRDARAAA